MICNDFQGLSLSRLGFGTMRLPLREDKSVDLEQVFAMTDFALERGVNYFDTAYPYHEGLSERIIGQALARHPRENWYLATKYPGHQIASSYDPAAIFEEQLQKCGVDYFDFYLLHNVCESSYDVYTDPKWGIVEYFLEQRRLGRIRHLGFSSHARLGLLRDFLDRWGAEMEFCQIQLNYLDWTLQDAGAKYALLTERGIPVWVMEPLRGGKLARLREEDTARLRALRPEESDAAWGLRWLMGLPNVKMILSGMSDMSQMEDNIKTFSTELPLSPAESALLLELAEGMKNSLPCTACRYCCEGCPMQLDIPMLLAAYNDLRYEARFTVSMALETLPAERQPSACIGCGSCAQICPQQIDIPTAMDELAELLRTLPSWAELCRQRDEANRRSRQG